MMLTVLKLIVLIIPAVAFSHVNEIYKSIKQHHDTLNDKEESKRQILYDDRRKQFENSWVEKRVVSRFGGQSFSNVPCFNNKERVFNTVNFTRLKRDNIGGIHRAMARPKVLLDVYKELHTIITNLNNSTMTNSNDSTNKILSDAKDHCIELLDNFFGEPQDDGHVYCNNTWDNFSCWPRTVAGTISSIPCPSYLIGINAENNATKYCQTNGTWSEKAVYDLCVDEEQTIVHEELSHSTAVRVIYSAGFWISTAALLVALFIFLYFRSLRCLRNTIHCHLIVTFIINNTVWTIMRYTLTYVHKSHHFWICKSLTTIANFTQSTNFFWMFVEGLYLHIIIVWTYSADRIRLRYLILLGWGLPTVIIIPWIIVRTKIENNSCWLPADHVAEDSYDYIINGPIICVLFANLVFLSTIVWVLITKLRASHSLETRQYRKAVRATVILFPLLGITYILFISPPSEHPSVKIVFKYINAVLQSFQGLVVAVFYCFLNGEVKSVFRKKLALFSDTRSRSTKCTRASYGWTRGSRDYGNSLVTQGNGAYSFIDSNRQPNSACPGESIPLNETNCQENTQIA